MGLGGLGAAVFVMGVLLVLFASIGSALVLTLIYFLSKILGRPINHHRLTSAWAFISSLAVAEALEEYSSLEIFRLLFLLIGILSLINIFRGQDPKLAVKNLFQAKQITE